MNKEYTDYLASQHWAEIKSIAKANASNRCEHCKSTRDLDGHHLIYRQPLTLGTADEVMILCRTCHEVWHEWLRKTHSRLSEFCRKSTLGALIALTRKAPKQKIESKPRTYRNPTQEALLSNPAFMQLLNQSKNRADFKKGLREMFLGKKRSKQISNGITLFMRFSGKA